MTPDVRALVERHLSQIVDGITTFLNGTSRDLVEVNRNRLFRWRETIDQAAAALRDAHEARERAEKDAHELQDTCAYALADERWAREQLSAAKAEVDRLRAVLAPFAAVGDQLAGWAGAKDIVVYSALTPDGRDVKVITIADLAAAAAAAQEPIP